MRKSLLSKHTETVEVIVDAVMTEMAAETEEVETVIVEVIEMVAEETILEIGEAEMTMVEAHADIHQAISALDVVEQVTGK